MCLLHVYVCTCTWLASLCVERRDPLPLFASLSSQIPSLILFPCLTHSLTACVHVCLCVLRVCVCLCEYNSSFLPPRYPSPPVLLSIVCVSLFSVLYVLCVCVSVFLSPSLFRSSLCSPRFVSFCVRLPVPLCVHVSVRLCLCLYVFLHVHLYVCVCVLREKRGEEGKVVVRDEDSVARRTQAPHSQTHTRIRSLTHASSRHDYCCCSRV